jgi:hypothetical protein
MDLSMNPPEALRRQSDNLVPVGVQMLHLELSDQKNTNFRFGFSRWEIATDQDWGRPSRPYHPDAPPKARGGASLGKGEAERVTDPWTP